MKVKRWMSGEGEEKSGSARRRRRRRRGVKAVKDWRWDRRRIEVWLCGNAQHHVFSLYLHLEKQMANRSKQRVGNTLRNMQVINHNGHLLLSEGLHKVTVTLIHTKAACLIGTQAILLHPVSSNYSDLFYLNSNLSSMLVLGWRCRLIGRWLAFFPVWSLHVLLSTLVLSSFFTQSKDLHLGPIIGHLTALNGPYVFVSGR